VSREKLGCVSIDQKTSSSLNKEYLGEIASLLQAIVSSKCNVYGNICSTGDRTGYAVSFDQVRVSTLQLRQIRKISELCFRGVRTC
jgi:hypothetical protein